MALRCAGSRSLTIALIACLAALLAPAAAGASQGSGVVGSLLGSATQAVGHTDTQLAGGAAEVQQTVGTVAGAAASQGVSETVQQTSSRVSGVVSGASQAIAPAAGAASQLVASTGRTVEAAVGVARTAAGPGAPATTSPSGVVETVVSKVVPHSPAAVAQGSEGAPQAPGTVGIGVPARGETQPPAAGVPPAVTKADVAAEPPSSTGTVSGRVSCATCSGGAGGSARSAAPGAYEARAGAISAAASPAATPSGSRDVPGEGARLPVHLPGPGGLPAPAFAPLGGAGGLALILSCLLLVAFVPSAARRLRAYSDIAADLRHPLILDRPG